MGFSILAADEKEKGLNKAQQVVWDFYEKNRDLLQPNVDAAQWAITRATELIQGGPPKYEQTPEYQAAMQSGMRALKEQEAFGNGSSSGMREDVYRFGAQEALNDVDRFYNRWLNTRVTPVMNLAQLGAQTGTIPMAQLNQQTGDSLANIQISKGNARAGQWPGLGSELFQLANLGAGIYGMTNPAASTSTMPASVGSVTQSPVTAGVTYGTQYFPQPYTTPAATMGGWW